MSRFPHVAVAVMVVVLAAACSAGTGTGPDAGGASPAGGAVSEAPTSPSHAASPEGSDNADVLAFTAPTLDGGTFDASAYAGQDVVLWLWAPW